MEDCNGEPSRCDFELTNFNPTGASTRFFKQPTPVAAPNKSSIQEVDEENEIESKAPFVDSNNSIGAGGSAKKPTTHQEIVNEQVLFSAEKEKLLTSLLPRDVRTSQQSTTKTETTNTIKTTRIINVNILILNH